MGPLCRRPDVDRSTSRGPGDGLAVFHSGWRLAPKAPCVAVQCVCVPEPIYRPTTSSTLREGRRRRPGGPVVTVLDHPTSAQIRWWCHVLTESSRRLRSDYEIGETPFAPGARSLAGRRPCARRGNQNDQRDEKVGRYRGKRPGTSHRISSNYSPPASA